MSFSPRTPPQSQANQISAQGSEDQNLAAKVQQSEEPAGQFTTEATAAPKSQQATNPGEYVQVPSSTSPTELPQTSKPSDPQTQVQNQNIMPDRDKDEDEIDEIASDSDLPPFELEIFQSRYKDALLKVSEDEDELIKEFDKLSESFSIWAQASAINDTERANKRLKTREVYLHMAEASLEEKKNHYMEVVEAFKKALELLRR